MKEGFYDKLEFLLQGQQNTYFVGGLMAFELTERNANYAMELVRKHFSNDNPEPSYPYVKVNLNTVTTSIDCLFSIDLIATYTSAEVIDIETKSWRLNSQTIG